MACPDFAAVFAPGPGQGTIATAQAFNSLSDSCQEQLTVARLAQTSSANPLTFPFNAGGPGSFVTGIIWLTGIPLAAYGLTDFILHLIFMSCALDEERKGKSASDAEEDIANRLGSLNYWFFRGFHRIKYLLQIVHGLVIPILVCQWPGVSGQDMVFVWGNTIFVAFFLFGLYILQNGLIGQWLQWLERSHIHSYAHGRAIGMFIMRAAEMIMGFLFYLVAKTFDVGSQARTLWLVASLFLLVSFVWFLFVLVRIPCRPVPAEHKTYHEILADHAFDHCQVGNAGMVGIAGALISASVPYNGKIWAWYYLADWNNGSLIVWETLAIVSITVSAVFLTVFSITVDHQRRKALKERSLGECDCPGCCDAICCAVFCGRPTLTDEDETVKLTGKKAKSSSKGSTTSSSRSGTARTGL